MFQNVDLRVLLSAQSYFGPCFEMVDPKVQHLERNL